MNAARLALLAAALLAAAPARAQQVFTGDPVDPGTSLAYPVMPGLPLLLPGVDEDFGTGDDVINTGITGDVDLVVRSGSIGAAAVPPPALAMGGPALATVVAGGGTSGEGAEATFTVMVSDGTGSPPYGNVVTNSDLDLRPVTVYAFADLDDDGVIGPTDADGTADNDFELQEATAYAGRQMGALWAGRFEDSVGLELAAPASLGGVTVALVAGAWTGTTPEELFTDGPLILTRWPFFPPLDPHDLLGGGAAPAPDPTAPNELEWDIETNYLPEPGHPTLGTPFAVAVDGSEPTTDQLLVESAPVASARVFAEPDASSFLARARPRLRVAPAVGGSGRSLVLPVERAVLAADGASTTLSLRVLPTDLFANVADPSPSVAVTLALSGAARIVSPDGDADPRTETLVLGDAEGEVIVLDDDGSGAARLTVSVDGNPVQSIGITTGAAADSDGDEVEDDGSASGLMGDEPCDAAAASCDDNCPRVINPSQMDSNHDGLGDCCDGTCIDDPGSTACDECALPVDPSGPTLDNFTAARISLKDGDGATTADKLTVKLSFQLATGASFALDSETLALSVVEAGSDGYAASLASVFTDQLKATPAFRYDDVTAAVDGVRKAQVRCSSTGACKLVLKAQGIALAGLAAGTSDASLVLGDDVWSGVLQCTGAPPRVKCELLP